MLAFIIQLLSIVIEKRGGKGRAKHHCMGITLCLEETSTLRVITLRIEETPTLRVTLFQDLLASKTRKSGETCESVVQCCNSEQSSCQLRACFLNLDRSHLGYVSLLKAGADDISPQPAATKGKRHLVQTEPFVCRFFS